MWIICINIKRINKIVNYFANVTHGILMCKFMVCCIIINLLNDVSKGLSDIVW